MPDSYQVFCLDKLNKIGRHTDRETVTRDLILELAKGLDKAHRRIGELEGQQSGRTSRPIASNYISGL